MVPAWPPFLFPPADYEIQAQDILMLLGKSEDIKKIKVLM